MTQIGFPVVRRWWSPLWCSAALAVALLFAAIVMLLSPLRIRDRRESPQAEQPFVRTTLPPVVGMYGRLVDRTLLPLPAGDVVSQHYPHEFSRLAGFSAYRETDFGEIAFEPDNQWYVGQDRGECLTTFNCCAFAVGDVVGLTVDDWLGTSPTVDGYPTPIAVVIDSYYDLLCEFSVEQVVADGGLFERDTRLHDDDLVGFELIPTAPDPRRRQFTHVGIVRKRDGVNRLLSKFGQGPVALTNIRFPHRMYPGAETFRVYRRRPRSGT